MSRNLESVIVRASMGALEYHEAAWEAHDSNVAPPDPSALSDPALRAILRYEVSDVPAEAFRALRAERSRRARARRVSGISAFGVLLVLAVSGAIIGWFLLVR